MQITSSLDGAATSRPVVSVSSPYGTTRADGMIATPPIGITFNVAGRLTEKSLLPLFCDPEFLLGPRLFFSDVS